MQICINVQQFKEKEFFCRQSPVLFAKLNVIKTAAAIRRKLLFLSRAELLL